MCERTHTTQTAGCDARLLDRAIGFALTALQGVAPDMLGRRTPCAAWDLTALILHLGESLAALHEGLSAGRVARAPGPEEPPDDPVSALRVRAVRVLRATAVPARVAVGGGGLPGGLLIGVGAVEVAVHGWDIAQATGRRRAIPPVLAGDLLAVCPLMLPEPRGPLFADPVEPPPDASPGERLVALLGRRPRC